MDTMLHTSMIFTAQSHSEGIDNLGGCYRERGARFTRILGKSTDLARIVNCWRPSIFIFAELEYSYLSVHPSSQTGLSLSFSTTTWPLLFYHVLAVRSKEYPKQLSAWRLFRVLVRLEQRNMGQI